MPSSGPLRYLMANVDRFLQLDPAVVARIRTTDEDPPRASAYDVIRAITDLEAREITRVWRRLRGDYPSILTESLYQFKGRDIPVLDARGVAAIATLLPGKVAMRYRVGQAIEIVAIWMVIYLGLSLATSAFMNWYNAKMALVER